MKQGQMSGEKILGISAFYHDSAAALIDNGEIVAAAQEERFSRKKGDSSFPSMAVNYCLREAAIGIDDVDQIVFYDKPITKFDRILGSYIHSAPKGWRSFLQAMPLWLKTKLWTEDSIARETGFKKDILFADHHQSHAASAFYPSPYEEAAIITVDGAGEWTTTAIGVGRGNRIDLVKKLNFPHSLGLLYSTFTYYCGFKVNSGEYKLMGLAPYGKPVYLDLIKKELITVHNDGSYTLNEKYFGYISGLKMLNGRFEKLFGRKSLSPGAVPDQFYMDIAASVQELCNEIMVAIAKEAKRVTGLDRLCIAGGVGLNCVANSRIVAECGFSGVWIQPAAGDAGGALGAAYLGHYLYSGNARNTTREKDRMKGSLLGPGYGKDEIRSALDTFRAKYHERDRDELIRETARCIADQKVVGWFQGRMEFGPRALGNRSILGDPRSESMQTTMNLKIKFRESFRPFAPSVIEEKTGEYFEPGNPSPYMLLTAQVNRNLRIAVNEDGLKGLELLKLKRSTLPAVTHVDGSARLQTVSKEENPLFHALISEFGKLTGCPVLINTSFNVRGEPVVCSPKDAFLCFMGTNIDVLVIGNFILYKNEQPENVELDKWKKTLIQD